MEIRFRGLISHVRLSEGFHIAVLLSEKNHVPELRVDPRHIVGARGSKVRVFSLKNTVLGFSVKGPVNRTGLAGVPSLSKMAPHDQLHLHVQQRRRGPKFETFVELPGGAYRIEDWYEEKGKAKNLGTICVPRTVVLDWEPTGPVTLSDLSITLKPDASIEIRNIEKRQNLKPGPHFRVHGNLFNPEADVWLEPTEVRCEKGTPPKQSRDAYPTGMGVECSNSTYP
jgi:hypothetical protein